MEDFPVGTMEDTKVINISGESHEKRYGIFRSSYKYILFLSIYLDLQVPLTCTPSLKSPDTSSLLVPGGHGAIRTNTATDFYKPPQGSGEIQLSDANNAGGVSAIKRRGRCVGG